MHISEGILSAPVLLTGAALAVAGVAVGLKRLPPERMPQAAILSSAFFVASLVHVPVGFTSAHLILNGLLGAILGWAAFPAILVALLLQAVLFQFGGLTVLGMNTTTMALPAVLCALACRPLLLSPDNRRAGLGGFICGSLAVFLSGILVALALIGTGETFTHAAWAIFLANLPICLIEGFVTAAAVVFLRRVKPEVLSGALA
ncbi:MAG: cobalt transporter CbiM [Desulfovibrio aminophilus]|jgi:cobalt/nickel transport system permease protein|uniref:cobalt transporter CbiM n=1 Tax=Desulfovibrio aminophilus TaxID=81425 RepID=UPI002A418F3A|nr:cobalt transporter CbiM [Desulfovibrionaceae bacterium]